MSAAGTTVIPVGCYDFCENAKIVLVVIGWVLDSPLDAAKVDTAWQKLCQSWPILASRLRKDPKTKQWQYHLPHDGAKSCAFRHTTVDGPIITNYRYPRPSDDIRCTFKENPDDFFSEPSRRSVDYLMENDVAITQLQVTSFHDATLVGISVPHVLTDGHGYRMIMRALVSILEGGDVPPLELGDPFARFIGAVRPPAPSGWRVVGIFETIVFALCILWRMILRGIPQNREIYFPGSEVRAMKQKAMEDLRAVEKEKGDAESQVWISTSDTLIAYCLKCIYPPTTSDAPFSLQYTTNLRNYFASQLPSPYIFNAVRNIALPPIPVSSIHRMTLGELALYVRQTLNKELNPQAAEEHLRWRLAPENQGKLTWFTAPTAKYFSCLSNWRDMKLMEIDFSAAAREPGQKIKTEYVWVHGYSAMQIHLNSFWGLFNDDAEGGVWMSGSFYKDIWQRKDGFGRFIRD